MKLLPVLLLTILAACSNDNHIRNEICPPIASAARNVMWLENGNVKATSLTGVVFIETDATQTRLVRKTLSSRELNEKSISIGEAKIDATFSTWELNRVDKGEIAITPKGMEAFFITLDQELFDIAANETSGELMTLQVKTSIGDSFWDRLAQFFGHPVPYSDLTVRVYDLNGQKTCEATIASGVRYFENAKFFE